MGLPVSRTRQPTYCTVENNRNLARSVRLIADYSPWDTVSEQLLLLLGRLTWYQFSIHSTFSPGQIYNVSVSINDHQGLHGWVMLLLAALWDTVSEHLLPVLSSCSYPFFPLWVSHLLSVSINDHQGLHRWVMLLLAAQRDTVSEQLLTPFLSSVSHLLSSMIIKVSIAGWCLRNGFWSVAVPTWYRQHHNCILPCLPVCWHIILHRNWAFFLQEPQVFQHVDNVFGSRFVYGGNTGLMPVAEALSRKKKSHYYHLYCHWHDLPQSWSTLHGRIYMSPCS